ncbi:hypothetical protein LUZ60_011465 [Juncus effusus]|nr:hypothetical protein LUZ60_011465 [Juncus effusus]
MQRYNATLSNIKRSFFGGEPEERNVLIFDLGAGTLDVSIVSIRENICTHKRDISNQKRTISRLRAACEQARIALSDKEKFTVVSPIFSDGTCFKAIITRSKFDDLNKDLAWRCVLTVHACLNGAKMEKSIVNDVILVGGSARIPTVQYHLWRYFDEKIELSMKDNLEVAVVYGASLQGFLLSDNKYEKTLNISLNDAISFSYDIKTVNGVIAEMIPRNTQVPKTQKRWFHNYHCHQRNLVIEVYESEGSSTHESNLLSKFELLGSNVGLAQMSICQYSVFFEIDVNGILTVSALDNNCGHENSVTIGGINPDSLVLENAKKKVWEAFSREDVRKMPSSGNVTMNSTPEEDVVPLIANTQHGIIEREKGQGSKEILEKCEVAIGIDLGTTCSCVGVWRRGRVEIIANEYGSRTSLSCVAFTDTGRLTGDAAKQQLTMNATNTIINVKRLIGRHNLDPNVQNNIKTLPFKVKEGCNGRPMVAVQYKGEEKLFTPEEITAMMLRKMKEQAEEHIKTEIRNVVITAPSYFSDSQRKATRDAGLIAGLNIMQLLNELTAAAVTYYLHKSSLESFNKKNILVFDLGGGTFDVSVLTITNGKIGVLASLGDSNLGGEDSDTNMLNHFVEEFNTKHALKGKDMRSNPRSLRRLIVACERAKRVLSTVPKTNIDLDSLFEGIDFNTTITKETFEVITVGLISRCIEPVKRCLENAKMDRSSIDDVVLVGGSTRMPMLQQELQCFFSGKELYKSINQDEAVTYGAAVQAAKLIGNYDEKHQGFEIHDVTSISLGIETGGGAMHLLVPRYSTIPLQMEQVFTTCKDNQSEIPIALYECFDSLNLMKEEIEEMIREAEKFKADDDEQKKQAEAMNALENFAFRMKEMANNPDMGASKKKIIEEAADEKLYWLEAQHNAKIEEINERKLQLEHLCNKEYN